MRISLSLAIAALTIGLIVLVGALALAALARADESPAPSPTPTQLPTTAPAPDPPSPELVAWARGWRKAAVRAREGLSRVRRAFGHSLPSEVFPRPPRPLSAQEWWSVGKRWRYQCRDWREKTRAGISRMKHPGGSGAARWRPLALYVGWPASCWPTLSYVITRESGGCVGALNSSSGCAGLLQIHPCHGVANVFDPAVNLRAGLRLYRAAGWSPWQVM